MGIGITCPATNSGILDELLCAAGKAIHKRVCAGGSRIFAPLRRYFGFNDRGSSIQVRFARKVAALFTHVALSSQDQVALHTFGGAANPRMYAIRSRARRVTTADYLRFLSALKPAAPEEHRARAGLTESIERFLVHGARRGEALIMSDFWLEPARVTHVAGTLGAELVFKPRCCMCWPRKKSPRVNQGWLRLHEPETSEPRLAVVVRS